MVLRTKVPDASLGGEREDTASLSRQCPPHLGDGGDCHRAGGPGRCGSLSLLWDHRRPQRKLGLEAAGGVPESSVLETEGAFL